MRDDISRHTADLCSLQTGIASCLVPAKALLQLSNNVTYKGSTLSSQANIYKCNSKQYYWAILAVFIKQCNHLAVKLIIFNILLLAGGIQ